MNSEEVLTEIKAITPSPILITITEQSQENQHTTKQRELMQRYIILLTGQMETPSETSDYPPSKRFRTERGEAQPPGQRQHIKFGSNQQFVDMQKQYATYGAPIPPPQHHPQSAYQQNYPQYPGHSFPVPPIPPQPLVNPALAGYQNNSNLVNILQQLIQNPQQQQQLMAHVQSRQVQQQPYSQETYNRPSMQQQQYRTPPPNTGMYSFNNDNAFMQAFGQQNQQNPPQNNQSQSPPHRHSQGEERKPGSYNTFDQFKK